ncbi:MAG TPA: ATP-binding cassette domain-containing protein [Gaiellaceae bacterium]|jgi:ABC-type sugar transport system ATPase subunit|nr:ATP-binding cassette domain-containing protein [Gaiellaceae bacterium]
MTTMSTTGAPLLEARGIQKHFGHVVALASANFELAPNEVHAIVGDNGAGKSTLIKIVSGVYHADGGELLLDGKPITISNPREARQLGIETVYQDLALADHLDAAANLFLGREEYLPGLLGRLGFLDRKTMRRRAEEEMRRLKIGIKSVDQAVVNLSGGQRQAVAVARAIAWGRRIVIMDEPTAALGVRESSMVLELIKEVRSHGLSIIMISHNLPEVFAVADRITVLRLGRTIRTLRTSETTLEAVVGMMTGAVGVAA